MRKLIIVGLLVGASLCGCSKGEPAAAGTTGETVQVSTTHSDRVIMAFNLGDARDHEVAIQNGVTDGLVRDKVVILVPVGSKAKVLEWSNAEHPNLRKIEILDGEFKGKTGFLPLELLAKPKT